MFVDAGETLEATPKETVEFLGEVPQGLPPQEGFSSDGQTVPAEGQQQNPAPQGEENLSAEEKSARYFQSQFSKAQEQLRQYEAFAPTLEFLTKTPGALDALRAMTQGFPLPGAAPQQGASTGQLPQAPYGGQAAGNDPVQRPERPQKPADYDPTDAVTDPDSTSWKFREQYETYVERLAEYQDHQARYAEEQQQQHMQVQMRQQQTALMVRDLRGGYGMNDDEIRDFMTTMEAPESFTLDNLVQLYRLQKGQHAQARATPEQIREAQQRGARPQVPAPSSPPPVPGSTGGHAGQQASFFHSPTRVPDPVWG